MLWFEDPFELDSQGDEGTKNPSLHESGQNRSMAPVALVQDTTAWSVCPVNLLCRGMKTTEWRTLALAPEIDVPMTKKVGEVARELF